MKIINSILFLMLLAINGFSQGKLSYVGVEFISQPEQMVYGGSNDELLFGYNFENGYSFPVTMICALDIDGNSLVAEVELPSNSDWITGNVIAISLPEGCGVLDGIYENLSLDVSFIAGSNGGNITVSNQWNQPSCTSLLIGGNPCVIPISPLTIQDPCCVEPPTIGLTSQYVLFVHRYSCAYHISANFSFPDDCSPPEYLLTWTDGAGEVVATGYSFYHLCGIEEYTLTVTWEVDGIEYTTSETITTGPECCTDSWTFSVSPHNNQIQEPIVNNISKEAFISPNPNNGQFQLSFPQDKQVRSLEVWNLLGERVMLEEDQFDAIEHINLLQETPGTYLLRIAYEDQSSEVKKFIIQ